MKIAALVAVLLWTLPALAYVEEELYFPVGNGIVLKGFLARPEGVGPFPALVLQMGHGQGSTDNPNRSYNPFAELARKLVGAGFVTFRFDKRGTGYNAANGSYADGTFSDYVRDLKAAVLVVEKLPEVRGLYLFGHSLGGPVISVAALELPQVKGLILSSAPGRTYAEFNLEQMRYLLEWGEGLRGEALESELAKVKRANELVGRPEEFCAEFALFCRRSDGRVYLYGQLAEFWREIDALDPLAPLRALSVKVASIQGTADWVISSENDGGAISAVFGGNPRFTERVLPGLDHFLLKMDSKEASVKSFSAGMPGELVIHPGFIPAVSSVLQGWEPR